MKKRKILVIIISILLFIYAIFPGFFYKSSIAADKISERIVLMGSLTIIIFVLYKSIKILKK